MAERTYSMRTAAEAARHRALPVAFLMMFACACLLMSAAEATAASVRSTHWARRIRWCSRAPAP